MVMEHVISLWCGLVYMFIVNVLQIVRGLWLYPTKGLDDGVKRYMFHDMIGVSL
jgi:hypothetical protein